MQIRPAVAEDIPALAALWAEAFPGERTVEQRMRQLEAGGIYGGIEDAFIAVESGETAGGFRPYALRQHIHGSVVPMMGLAAVAVKESARRRGLGAEMCRLALNHAYARGDVLSALYPFRPSYYEALGWTLTGSLHNHVFAPGALRRFTHRHEHDVPVRHLEDAADSIASCYARAAEQGHGLIQRTARIWRQHLEWPGVRAYGAVVDGVCRGYMLVLEEDRKLTIRELVFAETDAYDALLGWLSQQGARFDVVSYDARPSERFDLLLSEPRTPGRPIARTLFAEVATVLRGPMTRVVNVERALASRREWGRDDVGCTIHVTDEIIAANNGAFHAGVASAAGPAGPAGAARNAEAALSCDIRGFTQIYLGEVTVSEAVRLGFARLEGDIADAAALDALFYSPREFVLLDEF
jgi:predicted acetyltransferase